jgi:peroxiredoxin Q/BCP
MTVHLESGDKAPSFSLPSSSGGSVSLDALRGKKVVLYFYPKDDTPGCTKEACGFRDSKDDLDAEDLVVLGVSADDLDSHQQFIDKFHLNFPLLADVDRTCVDAYGVWGEKEFRGRRMEGIIRKTFLIDEKGTIMKAWHEVDPEGHAEEILQVVRSGG